MIFAAIPARKGSKGLPGKNMAKVGGETLIGQAVRKCCECDLIDKVVVTTDWIDVMNEATRIGGEKVETWLRPPELAGDDVPSVDVLLHVAQHDPCDVLVWVQCTAPLMTTKDIEGTICSLLDSNCEVSVAVRPYEGYCLTFGEGQQAAGFGWDLRHGFVRRQERGRLPLEIVGSVWALRAPSFVQRRTIFDPKTTFYIAEHRRLEVDSAQDLRDARALWHGCRTNCGGTGD